MIDRVVEPVEARDVVTAGGEEDVAATMKSGFAADHEPRAVAANPFAAQTEFQQGDRGDRAGAEMHEYRVSTFQAGEFPLDLAAELDERRILRPGGIPGGAPGIDDVQPGGQEPGAGSRLPEIGGSLFDRAPEEHRRCGQTGPRHGRG